MASNRVSANNINYYILLLLLDSYVCETKELKIEDNERLF